MTILRKILFPLSVLYSTITTLRNLAYDRGLIRSTSFELPVVVVGNLNVGGTGKSPHIEYLVSLLMKDYFIAVLSRGYKRKSTGFQLADKNSNSMLIGDEPLQFYKKFEDIIVAVDGDRVNGINKLLKLKKPPEVILLDDAFQHRKLRAGLNILLTSYGELYSDDNVLPSGNLRESKRGAKRANIIIITKCPSNISSERQKDIYNRLELLKDQKLYFSTILYSRNLFGSNGSLELSTLKNYKILLVTGIANSRPLELYLSELGINFEHMKYPDHYNFNKNDKKKISIKYSEITQVQKLILTTEKDYVRAFSEEDKNVYYLPIEAKIIDGEEGFNQEILTYVRKNSRDGSLS